MAPKTVSDKEVNAGQPQHNSHLAEEEPPSPATVPNPEWTKMVQQMANEKSAKKPEKARKGVGVSLAPRRQTRSISGVIQDH